MILFVLSLLLVPCLSLYNNELIMLNSTNIVNIRGPIGSHLINDFVKDISNIENDEIYIYINSPGGSVHTGNNIINIINAVELTGKQIYCIADTAMSMAFAITQACKSRYIMENSVLMQHQMSLGIEGQIENIKEYMKFINSIDKNMDEKQAKRMEISVNEFKDNTRHDWWLYGKDIIHKNAADKMVNVLCSPELLNKTMTHTLNIMWFEVEVTYSKCPLIRNPIETKIYNMHKKIIEKNFDIAKLFNVDKYINNAEFFRTKLWNKF